MLDADQNDIPGGSDKRSCLGLLAGGARGAHAEEEEAKAEAEVEGTEEEYSDLVSWSSDGSIRFWDARSLISICCSMLYS